MPSPMAHQTGFVYGMHMAFVLGTKLVLQDIWSAEVAARRINDEGCSYTMASTPFLADLANSDALDVCDVSSFRMFCSAGAPIPRILLETATERLGANILSGWGMTENGLVTTTRPNDPAEKIFNTDGAAVANNAVRIVDPEGDPVPANTEGRLQAQSIGMFVGYLKRPDAYESYDGWFETGDLARMDEDGYIRIVGRAKDIIIRGGENVPVVEVEELIYRHPAVHDVAVVAMPDERLGSAVALSCRRMRGPISPSMRWSNTCSSPVCRRHTCRSASNWWMSSRAPPAERSRNSNCGKSRRGFPFEPESEADMNGAESLVRSLVAAGVDRVFTNPGSTEMEIIKEFDAVPELRPVLGLFEGVCTGAADGYARMTGRPAATLLHVGPGLANGLANLHNAKRAYSPVVNIAGDYPSYHSPHDPLLSADLEGLASAMSGWVRRALQPCHLGQDGADAVAAAREGQVATLIVPQDATWGDDATPALPPPEIARGRAADPEVERIAAAIAGDKTAILLVNGNGLSEARACRREPDRRQDRLPPDGGSLRRTYGTGRRTGCVRTAAGRPAGGFRDVGIRPQRGAGGHQATGRLPCL